MARLNGKRRRAAAQRRAATLFGKSLNPSTQADSGNVRNAHKTAIAAQIVPAVARRYSPKPLNWEGKGKVKSTPSKVVDKRQTHKDTLREQALRRYSNGRPKQPKAED